MVVLNPSFEPRPDNYPANETVPTAAQLSQVGTLSFLDSHGNGLLAKATGNYTGTTDEILQWAANKWGFDPDITRANAVTETHWHQYDIGDIGNGVSLGILQVKSADFTGTCSPVSLNGVTPPS
jgi:autotransporter family porin